MAVSSSFTSLVLAALVSTSVHGEATDVIAPASPANATATHCELCCAPGGGNDACQLAFKGGPGVCCGMGFHDKTKAFCCPSRANTDVGFAKCYVSVGDGGYRCRQPSRSEGRFVEYDSYRTGDERVDGLSPLTFLFFCIFTAFLVRGCLVGPARGSPSVARACPPPPARCDLRPRAVPSSSSAAAGLGFERRRTAGRDVRPPCPLLRAIGSASVLKGESVWVFPSSVCPCARRRRVTA